MKLFTPGPVAMDPETIAIGGTQAQYFRTPEFSQLMLDCMDMLKTVLDAPSDSRMIFLTASGTGAMEASVMNMFTRQDKVLIISGGTFGKRFKQICTIHRIPFESIDLAWNESFLPEMLTPYENSDITGMLVNMCETSTGQLYPMDSISAFCKRNRICLVVDAISSFLCDPFSMKELGASAVIISSQKGLALHPGMSFVAVTAEAFDDRCVKNEPRSLYFRFTDYYPEILRGQTEFTPAIGIINQLHKKLKYLLKHGMETYINHCTELSKYFRISLSSFSSLSYVNYPLSNCVTPVLCRNNNAKKIVNSLRNIYSIYVVPAAGDLASIMFRVAHMSRQITKQDLNELINLLKKMEDM
jgi:aspartate aminotransferase-like enzyme